MGGAWCAVIVDHGRKLDPGKQASGTKHMFTCSRGYTLTCVTGVRRYPVIWGASAMFSKKLSEYFM